MRALIPKHDVYMDSSIFPTSVGANPMQSIYTFAQIFSDHRKHSVNPSLLSEHHGIFWSNLV